MALAVVTPKHLEKIGLLEKGQTEENEDVHLVNGQKISKNDITYLFRNALEKVIFFNLICFKNYPFYVNIELWCI